MLETYVIYSAAIICSISVFFILVTSFFIYAVENDLLPEEDLRKVNIENFSKEEIIRRLNITANLFFILLLASSIVLYLGE